jgi:hypothetical protein
MKQVVTKTLPRWEHARRISAALLKGVESAMEAGQRLAIAQNELPRPEFLAMLKEDLGISESTASKLMSVASHPVLSELSKWKVLPPDWTTLYALTKVPQTRLRSALEDGKVYPGMKAKDVKALLPQPEPEQRDDDLPPDYEGSNASAPDDAAAEQDNDECNPIAVAWANASTLEKQIFVREHWTEIAQISKLTGCPNAKSVATLNGNSGAAHWAHLSKGNSEQLDHWIEGDDR